MILRQTHNKAEISDNEKKCILFFIDRDNLESDIETDIYHIVLNNFLDNVKEVKVEGTRQDCFIKEI